MEQDIYSPVYEELMPGESVLWQDKPLQKLRVVSADAFLIPFSLVWFGMLIWLGSRTLSDGPDVPGVAYVIMILFVAMGLYITVGRFFTTKIRKKQTWYAVTNRRVLSVRYNVRNGKRAVVTSDIAGVPTENVTRRKDGSGSVIFGVMPAYFGAYANTGMDVFMNSAAVQSVVSFFDVADIEEVMAAYRQAKRLN